MRRFPVLVSSARSAKGGGGGGCAARSAVCGGWQREHDRWWEDSRKPQREAVPQGRIAADSADSADSVLHILRILPILQPRLQAAATLKGFAGRSAAS